MIDNYDDKVRNDGVEECDICGEFDRPDNMLSVINEDNKDVYVCEPCYDGSKRKTRKVVKPWKRRRRN